MDRPEIVNLHNSKSLKLKLHAIPTNIINSAMYKSTITYFSTGTPEKWLLLCKALLETSRAHNLPIGLQSFTLAFSVLKDVTLAAINDAAKY